MALYSVNMFQNEWMCPICTAANTIHTYPYCTVCFTGGDTKIWAPNKTMISKQMKYVRISRSVLESLKPAVDHHCLFESESDPGQNVRSITLYCQQLCTHFVDDQFPPIQRSIGDKYFPNVARWLRISEIKPFLNMDYHLPWTIFSKPSPSDIQQGALGNCWLVAAIALVAEHPQLLKRILLTHEVNKEGVYLVRICHNGLWKTVIVDDCFPCTENGQLVFTQAKRRQLYVPLIEKACAKVFGSYEALKSGTLMEGLQLLTGSSCDYIDLQTSSWLLDKDIVWAKLLSACESKLLIGVSSSSGVISSEEYFRVGIPNDHAFSILAAYEMATDRSKYVLVRDPHGSSAYQEPFLTHESLKILRVINPADRSSGAFWIFWPSFLRYFSSITISTYKSSYFDLRQAGKFPQSATDQVQIFKFQLNKSSTTHITLIYHRLNRSIRNNHIQSFMLCDLEKDLSSDEFLIGKRVNILISGRGGFTRWEGSLIAGTYLLIPFSFTFWYNRTSPRDYTAVIHSNTELKLQVQHTKSTFLADCLIASLLKNHDEKTESNGCSLYLKSDPAEVCVLMLENKSPSQHLAVNIDFKNDEMLLFHSRLGHHIRDCVPPLHRQIIFLAEWKNHQDHSKYLDYQLSITHQSKKSDTWPMINIHDDDLHTPRPM